MDRINGAGHVNRRFVSEDAGANRPPTLITDDWLNGVQEEPLGVIEEAGLVPNAADEKQLVKAIKMLFQRAAAISAAASGTVDSITANFSPAIDELTDGLRVIVRAAGANTVPNPTFTPKAATILPLTVVKGHNQPLAPGDFSGAGFPALLRYDLALNKWVLLNPATGVATVTATNDASFADNSVKPASTSWVRGAMAAIATAAGFVVSLAQNGYCKFPSWLGGWIIQWGIGNGSSVADFTVSFPISFPTSIYTVVCSCDYTAGSGSIGYVATNTNSLSGFTGRSSGALSTKWISIGK